MPQEAEDLLTMLSILERYDAAAQRRLLQYMVSKIGLPFHVEKPPRNMVENPRGNTMDAHLFSTNGGAMGGSRSSPKGQNLDRQAKAIEILDFLNQKTGRSYRPVEENLRFIRARLATCQVEDIKGVIARKTREWLNTDQGKWLRPATLFNATKFEQYIGEQKHDG